MTNLKYFDDYFPNCPTDKGFGYWPEWRQEIDRWLAFFHLCNPDEYDINKNRANRESERDGFLGEIKSAYFIGNVLKQRIIEFMPSVMGHHDFVFEDLDNERWNCEVKAPSWKAPIMKNDSVGLDDRLGRVNRPQYNPVDTKAGFISPSKEIFDAIDDPIKNSLESKRQFNPGENNLLIITPNMDQQTLVMMAFAEMSGSASSVVADEVKRRDKDALLSTILILEPVIYYGENSCKYHHLFIPIVKEVKAK